MRGTNPQIRMSTELLTLEMLSHEAWNNIKSRILFNMAMLTREYDQLGSLHQRLEMLESLYGMRLKMFNIEEKGKGKGTAGNGNNWTPGICLSEY